MTSINWIGIGIMAAIIIAGSIFFVIIRKKFRELDGFQGVVTQKGPRRKEHEWVEDKRKQQ